jgi:hypothetical protein
MNRKNVIILIALFTAMLVVLSCTLPIYIVAQTDTGKSSEAAVTQQIIVVTATPEATVAPTSTPTQSVTPSVLVYLDGPWTIWEGTKQERLDIDFLQDGFSLVGNASTDDGHSILYEGTISNDGYSVSGTWRSTKGSSGSFIFYLDSSYSVFGGNMGGGVPFCGNRVSSKKPSPCLQ